MLIAVMVNQLLILLNMCLCCDYNSASKAFTVPYPLRYSPFQYQQQLPMCSHSCTPPHDHALRAHDALQQIMERMNRIPQAITPAQSQCAREVEAAPLLLSPRNQRSEA